MKKSDSGSVKDLSESLKIIIAKAKSDLNLKDEEILKLPSVKTILYGERKYFWHMGKQIFLASFLFLILVGLPASALWSIHKGTPSGKVFAQMLLYLNPDLPLHETQCLIYPAESFADAFRPPVDCSQCKGIQGVKRLRNLSSNDFLKNYAFSMQPILVEDGQENWTASQTFSFEFFKKVYRSPEALEKVNSECQFFPYQTKLKNLGEFFNMSEERVSGKEEPWYIGWSNCDGKTANVLRQHYSTPYFIPKFVDNSNKDWIFMGLPGYGAHMHIDGVGTVSWQAQIKGTKKWTLQAPPECYGQCIEQMEIIVEPGQIIVLDTNKWFHATEIIGNDTSIVIGSEYY